MKNSDKFFDSALGWIFSVILLIFLANMLCESLLDFSLIEWTKRLVNRLFNIDEE